MDRHAMALMIPILGILIVGFVVFSRSALGHALARRIGGGGDGSPGLESKVRELWAEVEALRGELTETQERLDFTERMLASGKKES